MTPDGRQRTVAAFDFDGTLSTRDNFVPFLRMRGGNGGGGRSMVGNSTRVATQPRHSARATRRRHWCCTTCSRAATPRRSTRSAGSFASEVVQRHLRPRRSQRADWHRTQGHTLVIVSASLGVYLRPIAEQLRFDARALHRARGRRRRPSHRAIAGANVRGLEKARRLDALLATPPFGHGPVSRRTCGPTATAPATGSSGSTPTACGCGAGQRATRSAVA